jgi:two-component system OmpR family sensor kinase
VVIILVAATVAVALLVTGVQLLLARATTSETLHVLHVRADAAASTVGLVDGRPSVREIRSGILDQNIWIFDEQGRRIDGALPPVALQASILNLRSATRAESVVIDGFRLFARPVVSRGDHPVAVVVASLDLTPYESSERRGLVLSIGLGALIVLAAGGAGWASVHVSLGQVRRMVRRADDWREHDLSRRFDLGEPVDELTELGHTLDRMLDRIAAALTSERRLTDEVAHELRTPLSVIRSEAQLALQRPLGPETKDEALRTIVAATERMDQAIATMLVAARSAANGEAERCHIADALAAAARQAPTRPDVTVTVEEADDSLDAAVPLPVVVAALAPLLDNAVRHAHSAVRLSSRAQGQRVLIGVADDGAGVREAGRELIFQPGHSTRDDGAGLGLALARRLAHSMGGEVHDRGQRQGLFVLDLPIG